MTAASCQDDHLLWSRLAIIPAYSCGTAAKLAAHGLRGWQIWKRVQYGAVVERSKLRIGPR